MSTEYRAFSNGGIAKFRWPYHCAACARAAAGTLRATSSATSNAKFYGVYASWTSTPVTIEFPACWLHLIAYYLPMKLTGRSMWHALVLTLAVLAAVAGALGLGRVLFGAEQATLSALKIYSFCFAPAAIFGLAAWLAPVRVTGFHPPVVWFKIRSGSVGAEFERLNADAIQSPTERRTNAL